MSLAIISGAVSTHDVSLAATSVKGAFGRMGVQVNAQGIPVTTFASSKYVDELKGLMQADLTLLGYQTTGATYSDPLLYVLDESPVAFVGTAKASCTISFSCNIFSDGMDLVAAFNAGRTMGGRSTGAITGAWVTT